ncbi:Ras- protein Rab-2A, partial [Haplosporangium bisporale]
RDLTWDELEHVKSVMSTRQSDWALQQLFSQFKMSFGKQEILAPLSEGQIDTGFESLMTQIVGNDDENKDPNAPKPVLLRPRFKRAGIQELVSEWWERTKSVAHEKDILAGASSGAIVRTASIQADGSFHDMEFLVQCYGDLDAEPVIIDGKKIMLTIWDTVGTDLYRAVAPLVLRNAVGALLVYDVTSRKSFDDLSYWLNTVRMHSGIDTAVMVVGNKSDLDVRRCISAEQGESFAGTHGLLFAETSTARSEGIEEVFEEVALGAYDTMLARIGRRRRDQTHTAHHLTLSNKARSACCFL